MSTKSPTHSIVKKARARRVFGTELLDDADGSLCYSYTDDEPSDGSVRTTFRKASGGINEGNENSVNVNLSCITSTFNVVELGKQGDETADSKKSLKGPFNKMLISEVKKTASSPMRTTEESSRINVKLKDMRKQTFRSPVRQNLVKATQDAIEKASISVNESLRAANTSKVIQQTERRRANARHRRQWNDNKAEAKKIHQFAHKTRLQTLSLQRQIASHMSKERANQKQTSKNDELQKKDEELHMKSLRFRQQQQRLKDDKKQRHRLSMEARSKLRKNHKKGEYLLRLQRIQEDEAIHEERHETSIAVQRENKERRERIRQSFAFRNGDASRIRQMHKELESQRLNQECEDYQLKALADRDAKRYERQLERQRRESLAARNREACEQRKKIQEIAAINSQKEHQSYELKWMAEKDVEEEERRLKQERKLSLELRGNLSREQKATALANDEQQFLADHESYELKWKGEDDARAAKRQMECERRDSFRLRSKKAMERRREESNIFAAAIQHEQRSFEIKRQANYDVDSYKDQLQKMRRDSLVSRGVTMKKQRNIMASVQEQAAKAEHDMYEMKWSAEDDAKAYTLRLESERRASLVSRNIAAKQQRDAEAIRKNECAKSEHSSFELKWAGERDVANYKKLQQDDQRQNLKFRNKEGVRHASVMRELREIANEKEKEGYLLKWAAENDAKDYEADLARKRRESLKLRGEKFMLENEMKKQQQDEEIRRMHENEKVLAANRKDVQKYVEKCAERDRVSLEFRRKEARMQRIDASVRSMQDREVEQKNFELERAARRDIEDYLKECKTRRRLSLAFRAKEKRRHDRWKAEQLDKELDDRHRDVCDRMMDGHFVQLAIQQEQAKKVMESARCAGYLFDPLLQK